jgi:hypothetical protein
MPAWLDWVLVITSRPESAKDLLFPGAPFKRLLLQWDIYVLATMLFIPSATNFLSLPYNVVIR